MYSSGGGILYCIRHASNCFLPSSVAASFGVLSYAFNSAWSDCVMTRSVTKHMCEQCVNNCNLEWAAKYDPHGVLATGHDHSRFYGLLCVFRETFSGDCPLSHILRSLNEHRL